MMMMSIYPGWLLLHDFHLTPHLERLGPCLLACLLIVQPSTRLMWLISCCLVFVLKPLDSARCVLKVGALPPLSVGHSPVVHRRKDDVPRLDHGPTATAKARFRTSGKGRDGLLAGCGTQLHFMSGPQQPLRPQTFPRFPKRATYRSARFAYTPSRRLASPSIHGPPQENMGLMHH